ncbi:MAG: hypothetical protein IMW98_05095 [Firmicutes bacterium]|nr:hypothetical protein [Bacillota bacterium]
MGMLIAMPGVYICDSCVDMCAEVIEEELGVKPESRRRKDTSSASKPAAMPAFTPKNIIAKLSEHVVGQDRAKKVLSVAVYIPSEADRAWRRNKQEQCAPGRPDAEREDPSRRNVGEDPGWVVSLFVV